MADDNPAPGVTRRALLGGALGVGATLALGGSGPVSESYATLRGDTLTVGNSLLRRQWRVRGGALYATSVLDLVSGHEWVVDEAEIQSLARNVEAATGRSTLTTSRVSVDGVSEPMLQAQLVTPTRSGPLVRPFLIPDDQATIGQQVLTPARQSATRTRAIDGRTVQLDDVQEALHIDPRGCTLGWTDFKEQTDHHTELVHEHRAPLGPDGSVEARANVWYLEDHSHSGLLFTKSSMGPSFRFSSEPYDVAVRGDHLYAYGHGPTSSGCREWMTVYRPDVPGDRTVAAQRLQLALRPVRSGRDGLAVSNTWGDRSGPGRMSERFLLDEIKAAEELGLDAVQLDDGWQKGNTKEAQKGAQDSSWGDYWAFDADFWAPHPTRLPHGLTPVIDAARKAGLGVGMWFSPASAHEFANWRRDLRCLLDLIRRHHISQVKLDGVLLTSARAEERFRSLLQSLLNQTHGQVVLDLDVTAQRRLGYWGAATAGTVFVENRYTDNRSYWPHQTFRSLWKLAHHIPPSRLRMEFLNPYRNTQKYGNHPLAPARYDPATLFAMVMMASPLAWFEVQNAPQSFRRRIGGLLRVWEGLRDEIHASPILPVGSAPDGYSWAGFCTVPDLGDAYAVVIRPLTSASSWSFRLPRRDLRTATVLHGDGTASVVGGALKVSVRRPLSHLFVRIR
ncbi:hypothetical protein DUY81_16425 [Acidipropionibacterium acidipropionici]|uniref:Alpha-galactosidase n=1 Tax=Acidipropionibacterium acidipropionici TaxID=1748 RepID=A0AAC9FCA9_9ACTN|nr:alpha-galactosidase [Acidipropionibacterium acidipropionici]AMS06043.1 hypothetical protein AXH35_11965 [Acidipropionibacterium acidipropionici]AOZ47506.1 hypothetical protein A8L58_13415 [Acidipropionibacterium acidipropionici]AZP39175.1 hypothetical protein DUY81_16425 [Acidipropionibacterium acidipropionici]